ncbi:hypothetical protein QYE76_053419 [Lolium multiflorum]|uniref:Tf2-1-like SH3-like domain-containing protein n=1 Tax=Lolium multiflorum TaxID=4521 RepID=A0AAD8WMI8_LOLMU|nr:hypothetical protein QYE76_053419 [Lolium multiflorum]
MYLRCVTGDRPRAWVDWLSWAEYCYNTSFHSALRATPFEVVYGRPAPPIIPVDSATSRTEIAGELIRTRDEVLAEVRQRLVQAQQLAKHYYDGHHREVEYAVGDWVWLRLLHRSTQSLGPRAKRKLGPRYVGPFVVLERVGTLTYRLQLPAESRIHDVFHIHFEWVLGAAFVDKHSGMVVAAEDDLLGGKFDGAPDSHARCSKEWPPWM